MYNNSSFEEIELVPMLDLFDRLGINYARIGGIYRLFSGEKPSDGWTYFPSTNSVRDFAEKGRAIGGAFSFLKKHLGLSTRETFQFFEKEMGIKDSSPHKKWKKNQRRYPQKNKSFSYHRSW